MKTKNVNFKFIYYFLGAVISVAIILLIVDSINKGQNSNSSTPKTSNSDSTEVMPVQKDSSVKVSEKSDVSEITDSTLKTDEKISVESKQTQSEGTTVINKPTTTGDHSTQNNKFNTRNTGAQKIINEPTMTGSYSTQNNEF